MTSISICLNIFSELGKGDSFWYVPFFHDRRRRNKVGIAVEEKEEEEEEEKPRSVRTISEKVV